MKIFRYIRTVMKTYQTIERLTVAFNSEETAPSLLNFKDQYIANKTRKRRITLLRKMLRQQGGLLKKSDDGR